jgi:hypothetical protein
MKRKRIGEPEGKYMHKYNIHKICRQRGGREGYAQGPSPFIERRKAGKRK